MATGISRLVCAMRWLTGCYRVSKWMDDTHDVPPFVFLRALDRINSRILKFTYAYQIATSVF
ncbi:hypothetical protein OIDMADRAFT_17793 [Oidiodendron maius Zn]|uniref:Uncharacterized protein n=1 Tax=Oidiodendron maius (strain Zn) TaxID=913774 RepID=A0A0C3DSD8_OIDMZ|nr:hypothetical protein OIDMADRAFT_17793 [Oidiodendron maius Zn]